MSAIIFLLVLSVLVLVHEFGHYLAARLFSVKVEEFGYGFPPRLIGFVKSATGWKRVGTHDRRNYPRTIWSFNWLPLGGFVRLKGEAGDVSGPDSFAAKPAWQRIVILAAGVVMNWWLAVMIFTIGFSFGVPTALDGLPENAIVTNAHVIIERVLPDSPAEKNGLRAGDTILSIGNESFRNADDAHRFVTTQSFANAPISFRIEREKTAREITVTPAYLEQLKRSGIGIGLMDAGTVKFGLMDALVQAVNASWRYTILIVKTLAGMARDLVTARGVSQDVSGPVGIAVAAGVIAKQGWWPLMQFVALLSLNLSIVNFLPIPALDGGRALFVVVEWLRRKRNNAHVENALHQIGFVTLLVLVALVTIHDLGQYGGMFLQSIKSFVGL